MQKTIFNKEAMRQWLEFGWIRPGPNQTVKVFFLTTSRLHEVAETTENTRKLKESLADVLRRAPNNIMVQDRGSGRIVTVFGSFMVTVVA